jgi:hypothetical protein
MNVPNHTCAAASCDKVAVPSRRRELNRTILQMLKQKVVRGRAFKQSLAIGGAGGAQRESCMHRRRIDNPGAGYSLAQN